MIAIVILAGGKSSRMGRDKLALEYKGQTLLASVVSRFENEFNNVYLSVADEDKYPEINLPRVVDGFPGCGPMSGLNAAFTALDSAGSLEGVFLVAADLPFASPPVARRLIELCGDSEACVIRRDDGKLEPLFGYYRSSLALRCETALKSGNFKMTALLSEATTRFVSTDELGALWDERLVVNLNFPKDYEALR